MVKIEFNVEVAIEQFVERYHRFQGHQIDNASLPAGSAMYYYCRHCGKPTETCSESHAHIPLTICGPCEALDAHGLIDKAASEAIAQNVAAGASG